MAAELLVTANNGMGDIVRAGYGVDPAGFSAEAMRLLDLRLRSIGLAEIQRPRLTPAQFSRGSSGIASAGARPSRTARVTASEPNRSRTSSSAVYEIAAVTIQR